MRKGKGIVDGIRKYSSVMALAVRSSFYKVLLVMIGMCVAEGIAFFLILKGELEEVHTYTVQQWHSMMPEMFCGMMEKGIFYIIFMCSMFLVSAILVWTENERGKSRSRLLLWRLRISPRRIFILWSVYNMVCYGLLFIVQYLLIPVLHGIYLMEAKDLIPPDILSAMIPQTLFLVFRTNGFLHGILPLDDIWLSIRLLLAFAAWGMAAAYIGYIGYVGHTRRSAMLILFLGYTILFVSVGVDIGWINFLVIASSVICILSIFISVKGGWGYELGEV